MNANQAIKRVDRDWELYDQDRVDTLDEIRRLTNVGVSADAIAVLTGLSQRQVVRIRGGKVNEARQPRRYRFDHTPGRAAHMERLADTAMDLAVRLRDEDPARVWDALQRLEPDQVRELTMVALAGMPVDTPVSELFGWVEAFA
jgi:hypothetical protein